MKKSLVWFSLVEVVVSIIILSLFLAWAYNAVQNFYNTIHYIDSNLNALNISKNGIDDFIQLRNQYIHEYPLDGWEKLMSDYKEGTYIFTSNNSTISLSWIVDVSWQYEWPLDILGKKTQSKEWIYFLRKVDISEANTFYLKNIHRTKSATWELLQLVFSDEIYNSQNFLISSDFEDNNLEIISEGMDIEFYDINGEKTSQGNFSNIKNKNLRYNKVVSYDWDIEEGDFFQINKNGELLKKIIFYSTTLPEIQDAWKEIPIQLVSEKHINYYHLCNEVNQLELLSCDFHYLIPENFYKKLFWLDRKLLEIDFGERVEFSFSGALNNEIRISLTGGLLPTKDNFLLLNPFYDIKHNPTGNPYNILGLISDATSWLWVGIPEEKNIWETSTSTWYTSLIDIKVTTLLYDKNKFIDTYEIETKLWDIYRYQYNYDK